MRGDLLPRCLVTRVPVANASAEPHDAEKSPGLILSNKGTIFLRPHWFRGILPAMGIGHFKNRGFLLLWALVFLGSCFRGDAGTATGNTCTINKTCEAPAICWNGSCKAVPCNNNKSCSGSLSCQSSFCAPIYCTADSECPNDWYCESVGECVCVPSCNGKKSPAKVEWLLSCNVIAIRFVTPSITLVFFFGF